LSQAPNPNPGQPTAPTAGTPDNPMGAHILQDPFAASHVSPWSKKEKLGRVAWMLLGRTLFRWSFHNWYGYRRRLLRLFGAKVGEGTCIRPTCHIEIPWHIDIGRDCLIGDHSILYSLGQITIGDRCLISQFAHLCAGTHDHNKATLPLLRTPITVEADAWIAADTYVAPNVTVHRGAVLGARSSAFKDLPAWMICIGNPARPVKQREMQ
jgi:putative colanic acid biosynthesis acetyltransferase WcaF